MSVIDTPEGIGMWVLLSRRAQCYLVMHGLKVPGLIASMRRDGLTDKRTAKDALVDLNKIIEDLGGPADRRA